MSYSASKNGILRLILNRFVYSAEYRYSDGRRKWRCTSRNNNCKAFVVTKNNLVVRRMFNHIHPYHDRKILRMVAAGNIVAELTDDVAKTPCDSKKNSTEKPIKKTIAIIASKSYGPGKLVAVPEKSDEQKHSDLTNKPEKDRTQ